MNEAERRPLTDGYARQTLLQRLRKMGVKKDDITPEMIELERAKLEGVRTLREYKKRTKDFKGAAV
ncbi:MAG: hypothetical protein NTY86_19700 [Deltaproteobacteria bacterium]|nr:hypothetical protein [Deltaproteobacteria bacterium]